MSPCHWILSVKKAHENPYSVIGRDFVVRLVIQLTTTIVIAAIGAEAITAFNSNGCSRTVSHKIVTMNPVVIPVTPPILVNRSRMRKTANNAGVIVAPYAVYESGTETLTYYPRDIDLLIV